MTPTNLMTCASASGKKFLGEDPNGFIEMGFRN